MDEPRDLLRALQAAPHDERTFREWYKAAYPNVFAVAFRTTRGDRATSEDLCQDAVLAFMKRGLHKVRNYGESVAYLTTSVRNGYVDLVRRRLRQTSSRSVSSEIEGSSSPEDRLIAEQQLAVLLESFRGDERGIFAMLLAGDGVSDIANEYGLTYQNAATRSYRIRRKINKIMKGL